MSRLRSLRDRALVRLMSAGGSHNREIEVEGIRLTVGPGVCNPAPFGSASFAPLFVAALEGFESPQHLLDLGTGCGIWALLAARTGARVTATDLPHVDLDPVRESALRNELPPPRILNGDLFEPVKNERFDRIVFNPPFHLGAPADDDERAYFGGPDGEVVRSFLRGMASHLEPGGSGYLILPRIERALYASDLAAHHVTEKCRLWLPMLGQVYLLQLTPNDHLL